MDQKISPKVTVSIITYNQVEYIKQAVDSALAQEVDFPYEIVIGDDCSTDGTSEIVRNYKKKYPDLIRLNLQEQHDDVGMAGRQNNITNIQSARAPYIAFLDGDDYWISKDKLQKQADFMDAHPQFSFCCTNAQIIHEDTNKRFLKSDKAPGMQQSCSFTYRDVVKEDMPIITSSTFFRRDMINPLPARFDEVYLADLFLQLAALRVGPGRYMRNLCVGKVWARSSICKEYLAGRNWIKVRKNDHTIISEQFSEQPVQPYSYKSMFYLQRALYHKKNQRYLKMAACAGKVFADDRTLFAHWIQQGIEQTKSRPKKIVLNFLLRCVK